MGLKMRLPQTKMIKGLSGSFSRLKTIPHDNPELTPENWCRAQPILKIHMFSKDVIISQPTSAIFVYLLGVLTIGVGLYFFSIHNGNISRLWWGMSLLLWGLGALLAGTSYQAFGYEIKCAGRPFCAWTSWWEVTYLMCQQVSVNAMLAAIAYSCAHGVFRSLLLGYAMVSSSVYVILIFVGGMVPIKSLLTFKLMVQVSTPVFILFVLLNGWRWFIFNDPMDLVFLGSWILLIGTMIVYWIYRKNAITKKLWKKNIWFSEDDILHVCLIIWVIYIATMAAHRVKDW